MLSSVNVKKASVLNILNLEIQFLQMHWLKSFQQGLKQSSMIVSWVWLHSFLHPFIKNLIGRKGQTRKNWSFGFIFQLTFSHNYRSEIFYQNHERQFQFGWRFLLINTPADSISQMFSSISQIFSSKNQHTSGI